MARVETQQRRMDICRQCRFFVKTPDTTGKPWFSCRSQDGLWIEEKRWSSYAISDFCVMQLEYLVLGQASLSTENVQ